MADDESMRRSMNTWIAMALLVSSACEARSTGDDGSALQDALAKTLAADGFHIEGTMTTTEGLDIRSEGDYVAPDRLVIESSDDTRSSKTIIVGKNHYSSEPETTERFSLLEMPCAIGLETFISALSVVRAVKDIRQSGGGVFTFRADGDEGTLIEGEARIENGYLVELSSEYPLPHLQERVHERWLFSDFGSTVRIEPPPADQVVRVDIDPSYVPSASLALCPT
jgi:hypothetical protein